MQMDSKFLFFCREIARCLIEMKSSKVCLLLCRTIDTHPHTHTHNAPLGWWRWFWPIFPLRPSTSCVNLAILTLLQCIRYILSLTRQHPCVYSSRLEMRYFSTLHTYILIGWASIITPFLSTRIFFVKEKTFHLFTEHTYSLINSYPNFSEPIYNTTASKQASYKNTYEHWANDFEYTIQMKLHTQLRTIHCGVYTHSLNSFAHENVPCLLKCDAVFVLLHTVRKMLYN